MAPNTIDFNNVWANFDLSENAAVFSTVIVLIGIYIILLVWLRHMDKKDLKKVRLTSQMGRKINKIIKQTIELLVSTSFFL